MEYVSAFWNCQLSFIRRYDSDTEQNKICYTTRERDYECKTEKNIPIMNIPYLSRKKNSVKEKINAEDIFGYMHGDWYI